MLMYPQETRGLIAVCIERSSNVFWRKGRDSNSRYPFGYAAFRERYLQPLGHLSTDVLFLLVLMAPPFAKGGAPVFETGSPPKADKLRPLSASGRTLTPLQTLQKIKPRRAASGRELLSFPNLLYNGRGIFARYQGNR